MRRADRLFRLIELLRGRRCTTAKQLAEWLEVSERTVYRDIRDLVASGVPIDGEAGVGYRLARHFHLPPLMFNREELLALELGAALVESWADTGLGRSAFSALQKIRSVLPPAHDRPYRRVFSPGRIEQALNDPLSRLRSAIESKQYVEIDYQREDGEASRRRLRPLGLFFWGQRWTLAAWCEWRGDHRHFRLDRITALSVSADHFAVETGKRLEDYLASVASVGS